MASRPAGGKKKRTRVAPGVYLWPDPGAVGAAGPFHSPEDTRMTRGIATAATLAALALGGAAAGCAHHAPPPALRPMLTGSWVLVADSGHARPTVANAQPGANMAPAEIPEPRRGGRGGERGERGGEGGYNRARTYDPEAMQIALAALARGESRVTIVQTDSTVHFDFADASYFDLVPNGHSGDDVWRNVGRIKSMARWTETGLLFRRKLEENGVTVDQTFSRPAGSNRLIVQTVVSGPVPRPVTQRRVYDPAPAGK